MNFTASPVEFIQTIPQIMTIILSFIAIQKAFGEYRSSKYKYVYRERISFTGIVLRSIGLVFFGYGGAYLIPRILIEGPMQLYIKKVILEARSVLEFIVVISMMVILILIVWLSKKTDKLKYDSEFDINNVKERKGMSKIVNSTLDYSYYSYVGGVLITELLSMSIGSDYKTTSFAMEFYFVLLMFMTSILCMMHQYIKVYVTTLYFHKGIKCKCNKPIKGIVIKKEHDTIFIKNIESKVIYEVSVNQLSCIKHEVLTFEEFA